MLQIKQQTAQGKRSVFRIPTVVTLGSISTSLSCLVCLPPLPSEEGCGLLSQTAAGDRAYGHLWYFLLSKISSTYPSLLSSPLQSVGKEMEVFSRPVTHQSATQLVKITFQETVSILRYLNDEHGERMQINI